MATKITEIDKTKTYKFVPMYEETHRTLKSLAVTEGMTFDQITAKLINFYQANNKEVDESLNKLPVYYRPIQVNEDYSEFDESADIIEMYSKAQVDNIFHQELQKAITTAKREALKLLKDNGYKIIKE